jgi:hypothetical protein
VTPGEIPVPLPFWRNLFTLGCLVSALLVLAQALMVRRAAAGGRVTQAFFGGPPLIAPRVHGTFGPPTVAWSEALLFGFFVLTFYVLETWATYASPYFVYAQSFPVMLPTPPRASLPQWLIDRMGEPSGAVIACAETTRSILEAHRPRTIPIQVPLMEGTIAYVALHATRLVDATWRSRPFLAGMAVLALDALLDPAVSDAFHCDGVQARTFGLGLWRWFTVPEAMGQWYGIPLFNFGAWYASAIICVGVPGLLSSSWRELRRWRQRRSGQAVDPPSRRYLEPLVWAGILAAAWVVRALNPTGTGELPDKWYAGPAGFAAILVLTAFVAGLGLAHRRSDNTPRIALIFAPMFFLSYALAVRLAVPAPAPPGWVFDWWTAVLLFAGGTMLVLYSYWRRLLPWSRRSFA